jgi:hypothetical protein
VKRGSRSAGRAARPRRRCGSRRSGRSSRRPSTPGCRAGQVPITVRAIFTVTAGALAICSAISRTVASGHRAGRRAHDAVRHRLVDRRSAQSARVAHHAGPAICCSTAMPPVSRMTPWVSLGQPEPGALGRHPDVAQQRGWNDRPSPSPCTPPAPGRRSPTAAGCPDGPGAELVVERSTLMVPIGRRHGRRRRSGPRPARSRPARRPGPDLTEGAANSSLSMASSSAQCFSSLSLVMVAIRPRSPAACPVVDMAVILGTGRSALALRSGSCVSMSCRRPEPQDPRPSPAVAVATCDARHAGEAGRARRHDERSATVRCQPSPVGPAAWVTASSSSGMTC